METLKLGTTKQIKIEGDGIFEVKLDTRGNTIIITKEGKDFKVEREYTTYVSMGPDNEGLDMDSNVLFDSKFNKGPSEYN